MSPTLNLPAPIDNAPMSCGTSYGKRTISWTIHEPGEWHRNRYSMAWIEITERQPWRGEPLWLHATRRPLDSTLAREPFTDRARQLISHEVIAPIARYGFDRLWLELHRQAGRSDPEAAERARRTLEAQIARARAEAEWHQQAADLHTWHADGWTDIDPIHSDRETRVAVVPRYRGDSPVQTVVARVLMDGAHVGWITDFGQLIPLEDVLKGVAA